MSRDNKTVKDYHRSCTINMEQLPVEIAESILKCLDFSELMKISDYPKILPINFDSALKQRRIWCRKGLHINSIGDLKKCLKNIQRVKYCTKIKIGCVTTTGEIIKFLKQIDGIESLSFDQFFNLYDEDFEEIIAKHGNSLKHLNLRGCQFLSNFSLNEISRKCKNLISLNISECSFSSAGLELITQNDNLIDSLKFLDIAKCYLLDQGSILPLSKLKHLRSLSLRNLEWINSLNLPVILQEMTHIQKLDVRNCEDFTKQSLEQVKIGRETIEIIENTKLNDESVDSIRGYLMAMINAELL